MITEQLILNKNTTKETFDTDRKSEKRKRTILISWLVTGTLTVAFSIGTVELFTKMILYFFHERIWNTINWGK